MQTKRRERVDHRLVEGKKAGPEQTPRSAKPEQYLRRLTALQEISLAMTSTLDLRLLLDALLEKIDIFLPYSAVFVCLVNRENGGLESFARRNSGKGDGGWAGMEMEEMVSLAKAAIKDKAPVVASNIQSEPGVLNADWRRRHGLVSYLGVPMMAKGIIQGALCFVTSTEHRFTEEEVEDLTVLARQAGLAVYNSQLYEQTKKQAGELRNLARHLESVREIERTRVAREIHDELAQALTALKIDVAWLRSRLSEDQVPVQDRAQAMSKLIDTTMETVRTISSMLRPAILDDFGLSAAMQWQAQDFEARTGIRCRLSLPAQEVDLDQRRSTGIFRIFQETLTNVARHANATEIKVGLRTDAKNLVLEVGDNGRGITETEIYDVRSLGLLGMRERALLLGGEFNIRGVRGRGTTVTVRIPCGLSKK